VISTAFTRWLGLASKLSIGICGFGLISVSNRPLQINLVANWDAILTIQRITTALRRWSKSQSPDESVLIVEGKSYTASQLAKEMEEQTPVGILQLNAFEHAINGGEDLDELLEKLGPSTDV
jgi:hypothetical protein